MTIYEFFKNSKEKVKVEIGEYMGTKVVNIRVHVLLMGTSNEWKPTRKGLTIAIRHLNDLARGINRAVDEANKIQPWEEAKVTFNRRQTHSAVVRGKN